MTTLMILLNGVLSFLVFKKNALTFDGMIAAALLGIGVYLLTGIPGYFLMGGFFVSSVLISKATKEKTKALRLEFIHEKSDCRDSKQVLANGFIPLIFAFIGYSLNIEAAFTAFAAGFAVSTSDTWASEIGVLSSKQPFTLIHRSKLTTGLSGGVTLLGLGASVLGAGFIASIWLFFQIFIERMSLTPHLVMVFLLISASGLLGSLLDSILGELFQAKYQSENPSFPITEKSLSETQNSNVLIQGYSFINNDLVNAISCTVASIAAFIVHAVFL